MEDPRIPSIEQKLEKIDEKIDHRFEQLVDKLDQHLGKIYQTQAEQAIQLATHIKRTDIAEENLKLLREDLKPVEVHVNMVQGALKLIGYLMAAGSVVAAIKWLATFLKL